MTPLFQPEASATLAAGTTSSAVALPGAFDGSQQRTVRLYNQGPSDVFVRSGDASVVATAGGTVTASPDGFMCIPVGAVEVVRYAVGRTHLAGITASGTAILRITTGEGI